MSIRLGVNIDHVATLRNARRVDIPSPIKAAEIVKIAGAEQVTIHLREDRRHITDKDAAEIINNIELDINLEIAATDEMINFAILNSPDVICLVPEKREEITTEGGLNLDLDNIKKAISRLKKNNLRISLFIDPTLENIKKSKELDADYVELHTGKYANLNDLEKKNEVENLKKCSEYAKEINIICNAGHGLDFDNVAPIANIKDIYELNIGHAIISHALFIGLENSIKKMINIIKKSR